jgi:hypothetical protein
MIAGQSRRRKVIEVRFAKTGDNVVLESETVANWATLAALLV